MKKICFITTVSNTLKSVVLEIAKSLYEEYGYDITFICSDNVDFKKQLPEYIKFIPVNMKRGLDFKGIGVVYRLFRIFRKNKYDYIQYSTPNASFYASIAAWMAKSPIRLYGQWGIRYVGLSGIGRRILKILEKITCIFSTHIRPVSHNNMQFAIDEKLYNKKKSKVIGNGGTIGVDLKEFDISKKQELRTSIYEKFNITDDDFVFGFVGRISRDKGSEELLTAFKSLLENNINAKLFMVGANETEGIDNDIIEWSKNSDNVIYTGKFPKSELIQFYAAFDCYVHPTYREGFGMVLQEAGAMGNAIITTDIPGASEVMENNVSCMLVQPKDIGGLEKAMEYMISNRDKAEEIGKNAYIRTKTLYERSIMIANIVEDIKDVIGG